MKTKDILQAIKESQQDRKIKKLENRIGKLEEKNKPKTFFEKEWEKTKREAFED